MYICNAVEREIAKLKETTEKSFYFSIYIILAQKFAKLNMKELDLSKLENYNRHDLVERLLSAFVFIEHSNLRKLGKLYN